MKKALSFFQRLTISEKSAPLAFLVICIFSFGLLIPRLGFYMDDWPYVFYAKLKGIESLREMLVFDSRPNAAWLYILGFNLLTKLLGPAKWTYYYLYNILDVFSRYSVGWLIAERESATVAQELIAATCIRQGIQPGQLTIHADRGSSMTSKPVALLMADLGVTKTHS